MLKILLFSYIKFNILVLWMCVCFCTWISWERENSSNSLPETICGFTTEKHYLASFCRWFSRRKWTHQPSWAHRVKITTSTGIIQLGCQRLTLTDLEGRLTPIHETELYLICWEKCKPVNMLFFPEDWECELFSALNIITGRKHKL